MISNNPIEKKNPFLAAFLSFLIGGLGQFYNGEFGKGVLFLVVELVGGIFTLGVGYFIVMIISVFDAYASAQNINEENTIKRDRKGELEEAEISYDKRINKGYDMDKILNDIEKLKILYDSKIFDKNEYNIKRKELTLKLSNSTCNSDPYETLSNVSKLYKSNIIDDNELANIKSIVLKKGL